MLVSLNWLKEYVDIGNLSPEELAEKITKSGIEVDAIYHFAEKSEHVVVGYVESCEQHPNADKLSLCQVNVGDEVLQIACGAANVAQGQKVAVAKPGAVLPGDFKIKKVKLRGIESNGMICSLQELGIAEEYVPADASEGIFVFPEDAKVGESVESLLNLDDVILEFDLTPNRADALNMLGVAYEVAAILDVPIHFPDESINPIDEESTDYISVQVEDGKLVPFYGAFMIKDVEVKLAPLWMRNYLMAAGIRPINNVVDITNYVLLEYGQPLHAFDYDRLDSKEIVVRHAEENETITTLDNQERKLQKENLVITNGQKPVALAGVMGGANSEVINETKNILLESALFDGFTVRKTAQQIGLRSEASSRYEKGVDPSRVTAAGLRACQLLEKYANGKVLKGAAIFDETDLTEATIEMDTNTINKRLGTNIQTNEIGEILTKLQFSYELQEDQFTVSIPTRRGDITIFEDMLEEVARIYGYDNLPYTLPANASHPGALSKRQLLKRKVENFLQSVGLMEAVTYSLTNDKDVMKLVSPDLRALQLNPVKLNMPISEDHNQLRLSILPELLNTLTYNRARTQKNMAYYELGSVFLTEEETLTKQPVEQLRLVGAVMGLWQEHKWQAESKQVDFYVVKGIVEGLFTYLDLPVTFTQATVDDMHPGRCALISMKNEPIGFVGQIHPRLAKEKDLEDTYVFDLNMDKVLDAIVHELLYEPIPRYPSIMRDVAFIVDNAVKAGDIKTTIEDLGTPLVKKVEIFDVYKGENLEEDKKSVAYSLYFQDLEKTLKDDEVEKIYQELVTAINEKFNAYVRS